MDLPKIDIDFTTGKIKVKRKLNVKWTVEVDSDFKCIQGRQAEGDLIDAMAASINEEYFYDTPLREAGIFVIE